MKNFLAISFCTVFLIYQIGFVAIYFYAKEKNKQSWISKTNFSEDFKKVSIPLTLPYWQDQDEYQVADGEMIVEGVYYRKVFQKYSQDSVHILLALDKTMNQIQASTKQLINGTAGSETNSSTESNFTFLLKNDLQSQPVLDFCFRTTFQINDSFFYFNESFKSRYLSVVSPPPLV